MILYKILLILLSMTVFIEMIIFFTLMVLDAIEESYRQKLKKIEWRMNYGN